METTLDTRPSLNLAGYARRIDRITTNLSTKGWQNANVSELEDSLAFLESEYDPFREYILDCGHLTPAHESYLIEILHNMDSYLDWYVDERDNIPTDADDESLMKAELLRLMANTIMILWIDYVSSLTPNLRKENDIRTIQLICKQPQSFSDDRARLMDHIKGVGNSKEEIDRDKRKKFEILKQALYEKKGVTVTIILAAASAIDWLDSVPPFKEMVKFWGVQGRQSGIGSRYVIKRAEGLDPERLKGVESTLLSEYSSYCLDSLETD